jgi:osmoprotectant transport system ATP-binding protein
VTTLITFAGVTKRYPDGTVAVDRLDLEIPAGRITVLVGPSGCGKTTTLRMINRMVEPSAGTVTVDGRDVREVDPAALRRGIGYVIQQAGLFPHRTIIDNIATVPYLLGWDKKKARARAHELMERVGLDPALARRYPAQLSGGQQQRVGVARALAADPPIMLMDEPFSAVDPIVRAGLQEEFLRLQRDLEKTIVFVTHDIDEAVKLGHRIAVFRVGGALAQYATPAELLERPADDFVTDFLGGERGIRRLRFFQELDAEETAAEAAGAGDAAGEDEGGRTAAAGR